MITPYGMGLLVQLVSLNKVLTVSMSQIALLLLLTQKDWPRLFNLTSLNDYHSGDGLVSTTGQF